MLEKLVSEAITDFREVARLAHIEAPFEQVRRQILIKPHKAKTLPMGHLAIYAFFLDGRALKVMEWMPPPDGTGCAKVAMYEHPTSEEGIHGKG
jgi:hypothetical protein